MNRWQKIALACALVASVVACDGDDAEQPDPNAPQAPGNTGTDGTTSGPIPLNLWVDSMIEAGENADPDTVHDKNISDDESDGPYGKYFGK